MTIDFKYIRPILKVRFKPTFMKLEYSVVNALGAKYYKGDRVTWVEHRIAAYKMYRRGCTSQEIASRHKVPRFVTDWWLMIWGIYEEIIPTT